MDPTTLFAVDTFVVAVALLLTQGFKSLLELVIKPTDSRHDIIVRVFAALVGVAGIFVDRGMPSAADGHAWIVLVVAGALSGLSATGVYHFMTGSASPAPLTGTFTTAESATPTAADLATAVAAALEPLLARLVPVAAPDPTPPPSGAMKKIIDGMNQQVAPAEPPAPQSPTPEPAAPAAKPAE